MNRELFTLSRTNDPQTSKDAAESIYPDLPQIQAQVFTLINKAEYYGLTDEELSAQWGTTGSTARSRRSELAEKGLVVPSDLTRTLRSGRKGQVWMTAEWKEKVEENKRQLKESENKTNA